MDLDTQNKCAPLHAALPVFPSLECVDYLSLISKQTFWLPSNMQLRSTASVLFISKGRPLSHRVSEATNVICMQTCWCDFHCFLLL